MFVKSLSDPNVRTAVIERIKTVRPDARPHWGRMNANQMFCHLTDSFGAAFGGKAISDASGMFQRTIMKWGALWFPLEWPKDLPTRPEVDQVGGGGTPPVDFAADRKQLIRIIDQFCRPDFDFGVARHPLFGRMSAREWRRWGYLHADHHLRQFGA